MALDVQTKDCTALSDSELSEMADLCAEGVTRLDIGYLSKQREEWVLVTQVFEKGKLMGFALCTLERIGGTPALLVGVAGVRACAKRDVVLKAVMADQYRRALLAFPDEDVLVGIRFVNAGCFDSFRGLEDIVPRPGHKASGEERAWGRRLAKRFGVEGKLDDRNFVLMGIEGPSGGLDYVPPKPEAVPGDLEDFFDGLDVEAGDRLVAFGWAMAEDLASGKLTK